MNSQLNKDLFSETGCVKYPQLLAYRNGKLKQSDKHEVERHLIDCELCSDALEGFVLVTTGDPMEEVNTNIRELVKPVQQPYYKNYFIAAASVAAIVILSLFTYQQFLNVNKERMAISEPVQQPEQFNLNESDETQPAISTSTIQDTGSINDVNSNLNIVHPKSESTSNKRQAASANSESSAAPVVLPPLVQPKKLDAELLSDAVLESTASAAKEEDSPESSDVLRPAAGTYSSGNFITYVDNLKVIDYKDVDTENAKDQSLDKSTPVKFENKEKKQNASKEEIVSGASHTRKTTYTGLISAPVILYNQGRYESAIKGFDEVLLLHPDDQNAIFYKGMCFYQLANFNQAATVLSKISKVEGSPFAEEALFYVAKSYVEMEDLEKGTVLFQDLVNKQGFYSKQAALELKKLKK